MEIPYRKGNHHAQNGILQIGSFLIWRRELVEYDNHLLEVRGNQNVELVSLLQEDRRRQRQNILCFHSNPRQILIPMNRTSST